MGIKIGIAGEAAREKLYVPLKEDNTRSMSYGRPFFFKEKNEKNERFYIRYLNGTIGHMAKNRNGQLEDFFLEFADWVPRKEEFLAMNGGALPADWIIFGGSHTVREVTDAELECLPEAQHRTDEARFKEPRSLWEMAIGHLLRIGPKPIRF